jgi:protein O-mannosyl-transferase
MPGKITSKKKITGFQEKGKDIKNPPREIKPGKNITANKYFIYGIIILLSFILYGNTISNDYALDDKVLITANKYTQQGISGIKDIFSYDTFTGGSNDLVNAVSGGRYRPLSVATFAVETEFFGNNPHISHFINILLYALTCVLVFILLSGLFKKYRAMNWYTGIPFISTILFAAHPIHTEVVANIKGRDEILAFLFSISAFLFLLKYLDSKKMSYILYASALFFLAILSKEIALIFVVIIPLSFYFFTDHPLKKIFKSSLPLILSAFVFIILRYMIISKSVTVAADTSNLMNYSFAGMNLSQKSATITYTLGLYLKLLFFPHPLTCDYYPYHISIMEWSDFMVILSFAAYILLIYIAFKGLKSKSYFSYFIFLYLISLILVANILFPVGAFMAERFLYTGSLAFCMMAGYVISVKPAGIFKMIFAKPYIILVPVLFLYSFKTITRNNAWENDSILLETDVKTSSNSAMCNAFYGQDVFHKAEKSNDINEKKKYYEAAILHCEKAYKIYPKMQVANFILGTIYNKYKNDIGKSIFYLGNSLKINPNDIESYNNLGIAYIKAGKIKKAVEVYENALKIVPKNKKDSVEQEKIIRNIAVTSRDEAEKRTDVKEKAEYFDISLLYCEKAIKINPANQTINFILGRIYFIYKNDFAKSVFYLNNALKSGLKSTELYNNLGFAYFNAKQYDRTIEYFEKALELSPGDPTILGNIATVYNITGNSVKWKEYYDKTIRAKGK